MTRTVSSEGHASAHSLALMQTADLTLLSVEHACPLPTIAH